MTKDYPMTTLGNVSLHISIPAQKDNTDLSGVEYYAAKIKTSGILKDNNGTDYGRKKRIKFTGNDKEEPWTLKEVWDKAFKSYASEITTILQDHSAWTQELEDDLMAHNNKDTILKKVLANELKQLYLEHVNVDPSQ